MLWRCRRECYGGVGGSVIAVRYSGARVGGSVTRGVGAGVLHAALCKIFLSTHCIPQYTFPYIYMRWDIDIL